MAKETKQPVAKSPPPGDVTTMDWSQQGIPSGFEATRQEDLGIPFLAIIQDMSPQVKKSDPNYAVKKIEGASAGDVFNTLTNTVVHTFGRDAIEFIPCFHERLFVEWTPREKGGGMVKAHKNANILLECTRNEKGQDMLRNGNVVITTSYFYGLAKMGEEWTPCVIGMSSTQLKHARDWLNRMMSIRLDGPRGKYTPPMFSHVYQLSTVAESKNNNSWFGWKVSMKGQLQDPLLATRAVETAKNAQTRAALPPPSDDTSVKTHDDNVPFA